MTLWLPLYYYQHEDGGLYRYQRGITWRLKLVSRRLRKITV